VGPLSARTRHPGDGPGLRRGRCTTGALGPAGV